MSISFKIVNKYTLNGINNNNSNDDDDNNNKKKKIIQIIVGL